MHHLCNTPVAMKSSSVVVGSSGRIRTSETTTNTQPQKPRSPGSPKNPQLSLPGLTEGRRRQEVALAHLEDAQPTWVQRARAWAVDYARSHAYVTVNHVRDAMPPPADVDPRIMGTVVKSPNLRVIGYELTDRPEAHGRPIAQCAYREAARS